jgi:hypothetical protein
MKINNITDTLLELEIWANKQSMLLEDSSTVSNISKDVLRKAVNKFRSEPDPSEERSQEMRDYMEKLEQQLGADEKVEKTTLQKFFGFFRKHPRMIGLGVIILMLLSPILPQIAVIGLSLEKILSVILAGLYTIDIASPAVKTAMEL